MAKTTAIVMLIKMSGATSVALAMPTYRHSSRSLIHGVLIIVAERFRQSVCCTDILAGHTKFDKH